MDILLLRLTRLMVSRFSDSLLQRLAILLVPLFAQALGVVAALAAQMEMQPTCAKRAGSRLLLLLLFWNVGGICSSRLCTIRDARLWNA